MNTIKNSKKNFTDFVYKVTPLLYFHVTSNKIDVVVDLVVFDTSNSLEH